MLGGVMEDPTRWSCPTAAEDGLKVCVCVGFLYVVLIYVDSFSRARNVFEVAFTRDESVCFHVAPLITTTTVVLPCLTVS